MILSLMLQEGADSREGDRQGESHTKEDNHRGDEPSRHAKGREQECKSARGDGSQGQEPFLRVTAREDKGPQEGAKTRSAHEPAELDGAATEHDVGKHRHEGRVLHADPGDDGDEDQGCCSTGDALHLVQSFHDGAAHGLLRVVHAFHLRAIHQKEGRDQEEKGRGIEQEANTFALPRHNRTCDGRSQDAREVKEG